MLCAVKFQSTMFKIGQKVVCIKADSDGDLKQDEIYTIHSFTANGSGVNLVEVKPSTKNPGFWIWRFRKIDDTWVEELLCKLIEEVEAEELVSA